MTPNEQLATWIAEQETLTESLNAGPGVARPDQIAGKTGLEMMEAMLRAEIPYAAITKTLISSSLRWVPGRPCSKARRSRST